LLVSPNRDAAPEPPDEPTRKRTSRIVLLPKRYFNFASTKRSDSAGTILIANQPTRIGILSIVFGRTIVTAV